MRVWDVLFNEGAGILFRVALAIFKVQSTVLPAAYDIPMYDAFLCSFTLVPQFIYGI